MSSGGTPPVGLTPADGSSSGMFSTDRIGGFGYGVGVSVGILLLITTITLASYFCTRAPVDTAAAGETAAPSSSRRHRRRDNGGGEGAHEHDVELGIDEATLKGYPEVVYGEARKKEAKQAAASGGKKLGTTCTCCSICLDNYGDGEVLRMLPECGHLFHRECVDPWLRHHPTCPVCRTSPVPSPLPTPLAEVTPLAMARMSS